MRTAVFLRVKNYTGRPHICNFYTAAGQSNVVLGNVLEFINLVVKNSLNIVVFPRRVVIILLQRKR